MDDSLRDSPAQADTETSDHLTAAASTGDVLTLDRFIGKVPVALCFVGRLDSPVTAEVVRGFDEHLASFGRSRVQALIVVAGDAGALDEFRADVPGNAPLLADDGSWAQRFGVVHAEKQLTTVLLDEAGTKVDEVRGAAGGVHAEEVLERLHAGGMA